MDGFFKCCCIYRAIFNLFYGVSSMMCVTSFRGVLQTNRRGPRFTQQHSIFYWAPNSNKWKSSLPLMANEVIDTFSWGVTELPDGPLLDLADFIHNQLRQRVFEEFFQVLFCSVLFCCERGWYSSCHLRVFFMSTYIHTIIFFILFSPMYISKRYII